MKLSEMSDAINKKIQNGEPFHDNGSYQRLFDTARTIGQPRGFLDFGSRARESGIRENLPGTPDSEIRRLGTNTINIVNREFGGNYTESFHFLAEHGNDPRVADLDFNDFAQNPNLHQLIDDLRNGPEPKIERVIETVTVQEDGEAFDVPVESDHVNGKATVNTQALAAQGPKPKSPAVTADSSHNVPQTHLMAMQATYNQMVRDAKIEEGQQVLFESNHGDQFLVHADGSSYETLDVTGSVELFGIKDDVSTSANYTVDAPGSVHNPTHAEHGPGHDWLSEPGHSHTDKVKPLETSALKEKTINSTAQSMQGDGASNFLSERAKLFDENGRLNSDFIHNVREFLQEIMGPGIEMHAMSTLSSDEYQPRTILGKILFGNDEPPEVKMPTLYDPQTGQKMEPEKPLLQINPEINSSAPAPDRDQSLIPTFKV